MNPCRNTKSGCRTSISLPVPLPLLNQPFLGQVLVLILVPLSTEVVLIGLEESKEESLEGYIKTYKQSPGADPQVSLVFTGHHVFCLFFSSQTETAHDELLAAASGLVLTRRFSLHYRSNRTADKTGIIKRSCA